MKKIILLISALVLVSVNQGFSQGWIGNSTNNSLYPLSSTLDPANIKIGIGTDQPATSLHLQGTSPLLRISDGTQNNGFILISDALGNAQWQDPNAIFSSHDNDWYKIPGGSEGPFDDPADDINSNIYTLGKVGIGTSLPGVNAALAVQTDIFSKRIDAGFHKIKFGYNDNDVRYSISVANSGNGINNKTLLGYYMQYTGDDANTFYTASANTSSPSGIEFLQDRIRFITGAPAGNGTNFTPSESFTIANDGNVGIGVSNPNFKLDVRGNIYVNSLHLGKHNNASYAYGVFGKIDGKGNGDGNLYFAPRNLNTSTGAYMSLGQYSSDTDKGDIKLTAGYYDQVGMHGKIKFNTGGGATDVIIDENGNMGIGFETPSYKLMVDGEAYFNGMVVGKSKYHSDVYGFFGAFDSSGKGNGNLYFAPRNINPNNGSYISLGQRDSNADKGDVKIVAGYYDDLQMHGKIKFTTGSGGNVDVIIDENGNMGIGTALTNNPNDYKLAVNGKLGVSASIHVEDQSVTWADYVFEEDYNLRSLEKVENFIKANKHLPDVPSAKTVEENGISVVEMDATLLRKIEELTLYMIEMKKQNDVLVEKVKTLEKQIQK